MTVATRPLMFGYLRAHLLMTQTELADTKDRLAYVAHTEGYALGTVFIEHLPTVPAAFAALIEAVDQHGAEAIVVPSPMHLAVLGRPPLMTNYLQNVTGVRVLVANSRP